MERLEAFQKDIFGDSRLGQTNLEATLPTQDRAEDWENQTFQHPGKQQGRDRLSELKGQHKAAEE